VLLQLDQVALAHHRQGGERLDRIDRRRVNMLQGFGEIRRVGLGVRNLLRQACRQRRLSFVGTAGFEGVEGIWTCLLRIE
jgi:hypothetical protein